MELLEDRNAPGVLFDVARPFAPDVAVLKSSLRLNDIQSFVDPLRDISITGLDGFANVPGRSQSVAQQRTEPRRVDAASPLSFALTELNDVLKSSSSLIVYIPSNEGTPLPSTVAFTEKTMGYALDGSGIFQGISNIKGTHSETIQSNSTLNAVDSLYSILTSDGMKSPSLKGDDPAPNWGQTEYGNIRIDCTTNLASGGNPEGILGNNAKLIPGWFSNVNWSADWNNKNGWDPDTTKTTTATNSAIYTPDKDKSVVVNGIAGGDPDLRKFVVYVTAHNNTGNNNWDFKLTFPASVRVY
ncbi:MAG: hypothetical protein JNJ77_04035 [Planctomycetia bacterium]|nr:hypothetical protein [Planctomycetia bacterium]